MVKYVVVIEHDVVLWLILMLNPVTCRKDGDDKARPVIIHRAILGSVERMIAILTENYAGKWWVAKRTNEFVECYIRCNHRLENQSCIKMFFLLLNVLIMSVCVCVYIVFWFATYPAILCFFSRPLWLSPRQVMFVPVNPTCEEYAKRVTLAFYFPNLSSFHISTVYDQGRIKKS